jgi:photosystem II stability/assembly factor-like uncharacterized protein
MKGPNPVRLLCLVELVLASPAPVLGQGLISPMIPSNSVSHTLAIGDTLWLGTGKGLSRSVNHGQSWEDFRQVSEFANPGIFSLAVEGDTIWSSTGFEEKVNNDFVPTGSGLTYSLDGGQSWHHLPQPMDAPSDSVIQYGINRMQILPIIVPEQNVTYDVSLMHGTIWITSWAGGLRRTTDNGQTWQRIILPPDNYNKISPSDTLSFIVDPRENVNFTPFSVLATSDSEIWVGTAGGVNESTDGGLSWVKFNHQNQDSSILGNWVIRIKEQLVHGKRRIWTTNWVAEDPTEQHGVSYTDNSGLSWHNLLQDIKAYDFAFKDTIMYVATDDGVYRTGDDGHSWSRASVIVDPISGERFATTSILSVGVQADTVWVAGNDGVASTIDDASHAFGQTWVIKRTYVPVGSSSVTYAYPNPFSAANKVVRIHYSTGGKDSNVNIRIFDFGMNLVKTLLRQAPRSGANEHDEIWDGRDDSGRLVSNGVYFYKVEVENGASGWGKVIVLQ